MQRKFRLKLSNEREKLLLVGPPDSGKTKPSLLHW